MATEHPEPPWNYLCEASVTSLQSYELSRLNHAANLRKQIGALLEQWVEENTSALLARWLLEQGERCQRALAVPGTPSGSRFDLFAGPIEAQLDVSSGAERSESPGEEPVAEECSPPAASTLAVELSADDPDFAEPGATCAADLWDALYSATSSPPPATATQEPGPKAESPRPEEIEHSPKSEPPATGAQPDYTFTRETRRTAPNRRREHRHSSVASAAPLDSLDVLRAAYQSLRSGQAP